MKIKPGNFIN